MCHFFLGDGASDCCMDQSRLQGDPGLGFGFFFFSYYPLSIQWVHGAILDARNLSRMLVFFITTGEKKKQPNLLDFPLCQ